MVVVCVVCVCVLYRDCLHWCVCWVVVVLYGCVFVGWCVGVSVYLRVLLVGMLVCWCVGLLCVRLTDCWLVGVRVCFV